MKKLCIVAHFDSAGFFQWYVAFQNRAAQLGIELSSINASPTHKKVYNDFDTNLYWKPMKEADYLFVYATRRSYRSEQTGISWWTLPRFVKCFMKDGAKMIAQYDDEFQWLFDPKHVWWAWGNPDNLGGPEQFFKKTGILEIPDAHFTVTTNPPYTKYTTKPVFKMLLPQIFRYSLSRYSEEHREKNIAMMIHSIRQSSVDGFLENVIRPNNWAVTIFNGTLDNDIVSHFRMNTKLPVNSQVFPRLGYGDYEDLLWQNASIGLDDNVGYSCWSRFVMECAIAYIPCVGSTEAVRDIFPELYVVSQDYAKEIELINKLKTNKKFYHEIAQLGHKRITEILDDEKQCKTFLDIFEKIPASKTLTIKDILPFYHTEYNADKQQARPHP
jgi:hypothetical protein